MSVVGEAALSVLLELLFSRLVSSALNFVADHKQVHEQLKEWQSKLPDIQGVLDDAEQKQITNDGVKKWLADLQDLAYDVDDILDEFAYEDLRLKLPNTQSQASTSKVRKLIPTCCTSCISTPASFLFNNMMISKIKEITARLNSLATRRSSLGLIQIMSQGASSKEKKSRLQPTSLLDETIAYVGRDIEKQEILELLKSSNTGGEDRVSVITIVGTGGMGKTTLAQLVYNDASIKESFDHKAWVCVSDDFDAITITKTILKSITSEACDDNDLNLLQVKLKEKLSEKKFLLVLDDIWNESYNDWTILRSPFAAGTKIIVTTRLQRVSSNVGAVKTFHLDKLSHDDCLSIFAQHALRARDFNEHLEFKEVGENIVRRCKGLPLAAKAIGGLLSQTTMDLGAWEKVYKSEIWDLPEDQCDIIPALRLSYHHLPSHLKRCFAYCSIFPKDYEFEEEEIILLWRAEGFLQQKFKSPIKDLGNQYFRDLVSRSFLQISSKNKSQFVMHDLINDLAQSVAGEICSKFEDDKQQKVSNRTRHSSYVRGQYDRVKVFEAFDQVGHLRTFLPLKLQSYYKCYLTNIVLVDLLPRLSYLRMLSLSGYEITELPDYFFENLKHMRHLNFSDTQIKYLPESLCILYHLETLILKGCSQLEKLPSKIGDLSKLHYLDVSRADSIKSMPSGVGKLTNLQRLSHFILGEGDGLHIGELKNLSNLSGDFCILGLENVNVEDARKAKLNEKSGIDRLELQWNTDVENDTRNKEVEERVLDFLHPQENLKQLIIKNYGGAKFSAWIADSSFKNLLSLELINCENCKSLPSIGRLPKLKDLSIVGLNKVSKVGVEFFGENQSNAFASLETLSFRDLPNWKEWDPCEGDEQVSKLPRLQQLSIWNCPELLGKLPTHLHSLQELEIQSCSRLVVSISSFPSLGTLEINGCEELVDACSSVEVTSLKIVTLSNISKFSIPTERIMSRFASSEHFEIDGWKEMTSFSQNGLGIGLLGHRFIQILNCPQFVSLETEEAEEERLQIGKISAVEFLTIRNCERLNRLPKIFHALTFLTEMQIEGCPALVSFADNNLPPALKSLVILDCMNLQYLVDETKNESMGNKFLPERLVIERCPSLICLSSRGDTPNRLRHLEIDGCLKLTCLFSNAKLPKTLKQLRIWSCPELECIAQEFDETSCLEFIGLSSCHKIKCLPRGFDKLCHLQEIRITACSNLVSFEESGLPTTNLKVLAIRHCEKFGALPKCINNFTSLKELSVMDCSADICFPEEGFPTNLTSLKISNAPKIYRSLVQWGLDRLTFLQELTISGEGCSHAMSFPEEEIGMMLPPSLTCIGITNFENLEYMSSKGFQDLTSLQDLYIFNCFKLSSLPEKDMLLSLGRLEIHNCPLLKENCRRDREREWSKIAHIPLVTFDNKSVIPRELD